VFKDLCVNYIFVMNRELEIATIGAINWDINIYVKRFPRAGEEVKVKKVDRVPGGTAANVAVAAARYLGKDKVALVAALGDDPWHEEHFNILWDEGILTDGIKVIEGVISGTAYIIIDESGENIIHTYFGANEYLNPTDVNKEPISSILYSSKVVVVMDPPIDTAMNIIKDEGINAIKMWDPGVYSELGLNFIADGAEKTDILILNKTEVEKLFGSIDINKIYRWISDINRSIKFIIKMGGEGLLAIDPSSEEYIKVPPIPLEKLGLRVVNTVGSGDAFIGVFASHLSKTNDFVDSLLMGSCAGAYKATRMETRGSPSYDELMKLYERVVDIIYIDRVKL